MELDDIRQLLEGEGLIGMIQPATPEAPLDQLVVVLENVEGRQLGLQIAYLPDEDAEIEHARLLQFYVGLPGEVAEADLPDLHRRIDTINSQIPLGAFSYHAEARGVYFRHVTPMPRGSVPALGPVIVETVWLIDFVMDSVADQVLATASA
jgi:hypothetical protein